MKKEYVFNHKCLYGCLITTAKTKPTQHKTGFFKTQLASLTGITVRGYMAMSILLLYIKKLRD